MLLLILILIVGFIIGRWHALSEIKIEKEVNDSITYAFRRYSGHECCDCVKNKNL